MHTKGVFTCRLPIGNSSANSHCRGPADVMVSKQILATTTHVSAVCDTKQVTLAPRIPITRCRPKASIPLVTRAGLRMWPGSAGHSMLQKSPERRWAVRASSRGLRVLRARCRFVNRVQIFPGMQHVDVAGGTGDIAFAIYRRMREAEQEAAAGSTDPASVLRVCPAVPSLTCCGFSHHHHRAAITVLTFTAEVCIMHAMLIAGCLPSRCSTCICSP